VPSAQPLFRKQQRLPHISTIAFPGIVNELMAFALDRKGIAVSIGGGTLQQVGMCLQACGIDEELAQCAISFSLSRYTNEEEVEATIQAVKEVVESYATLQEQADKGVTA
jgi:cysteine desulfurase